MQAHNRFFRLNTQEKSIKHNTNKLSTIINCCYAVDNLEKTSIMKNMAEILFWNECKKTLERDLALRGVFYMDCTAKAKREYWNITKILFGSSTQ